MRETPAFPRDLRGRVALVAGATRGAGRAIAVALGACGATVCATGRSSREHPGARPETIKSRPHRGRHHAKAFGVPYPRADEAAFASWWNGPAEVLAASLKA